MDDKSHIELDQARNQVKVFESRFEAIAQTASDSIIISDENSIIVFANKRANNVFGYNENELIGKNLHQIMPQKHRRGHSEGVKRYIHSGIPKLIGHTIEIEGLKKDGTIFPVELSLSSWKENDKHYFSGIMRDISERKEIFNEISQLNNKLQEQQIQLETANEELFSLNEELHITNKELIEGKNELQVVLKKLSLLNNELEQRVAARTKELSSSETQLRLITDALPVLIAYVDSDQIYRFNNLAYEKWFKISRKQVYGKHLKEVIGEEAYETVEAIVKRVLHGESIYLETKLNYKSIGEKYVSINYIPHIIKEKVLGYYTLISDISEHKKIQEDLVKANNEINLLLEREKSAFAEVKAQQRRLYNLLMQAPSLVAILGGKDFVFELANPPYLEILGITTSIEGKTLKEVIPNLDPVILDILNNVYDKGERFIGKEFPIELDWNKGKEPYIKYFNFIYEPVREIGGKISSIMTFGYEVTEHVIARENLEKNAWTMKQMNKALKRKNQDLIKLNIDLDNFIYTASHDLKSPAVNLEGLVSLLKSEFDHKFEYKDKNLIEMIEKSIHKLYKTIFDLTEITKVQKDINGALENVSLKEILEDVKIDLNKNIQTAEAILEENIEVNNFVFNKSNLRSIIYNLLSNAIKYRSPERPLKISISSFLENDTVILCVKDNGLGIDDRQISKLFTMFKRMHTHVEGTGIGLYIIKRIIENNGGRIEVESKKNIGTAFKVFFPTKNQDENIFI